MGHVLEGILRLPPVLALSLVFLLPALEASVFVGVIVPGEVGVILGGVLANQHKIAVAPVLVAGAAGAIIGDSVGYAVGRRYGETLLSKIPKRVLKPQRVCRAEETMRRFGGKSVFIGRFTAALRAVVPGLAGMSRLPYGRFLAWNAAGGLVWASGFVLLGYLAGSQYKRIEHYANYLGLALLAVVLLTIYLRHRTSRDRAESASTHGAAPERPVQHRSDAT